MSELHDLYVALAKPFEGYYTANGVNGPFLSGEQVTTRLNEVLGVGMWQYTVSSFSVVDDEVIALGELRAFINDQWVTRSQFGGVKVKRKNDGTAVSLADEHKGAATDALKKCASMLGVGLYMMVSHANWHPGVPAFAPAAQPAYPRAAAAQPGQPAYTARGAQNRAGKASRYPEIYPTEQQLDTAADIKMVTDAQHDMYKGYWRMAQRAERVHVPYTIPELPMSESDLNRVGKALQAAVLDAELQAKAAEQATPA